MSIVMPTVDTTKKPARTADWHRADIKAALEKSGWSLRSLSISNDYDAKSLAYALSKPWPRAEKIIATAIGIRAQRIWPSRYNSDGTPKSGRGERGLGRSKSKRSTGRGAGNVHLEGSR
jgi:Ner family transcriptional regulator